MSTNGVDVPNSWHVKAHRVSPAWRLAWAEEEGWQWVVWWGAGLEKRGGDWGEVGSFFFSLCYWESQTL